MCFRRRVRSDGKEEVQGGKDVEGAWGGVKVCEVPCWHTGRSFMMARTKDKAESSSCPFLVSRIKFRTAYFVHRVLDQMVDFGS